MNSINTNLMALHAANTLNSHYGHLSASVERLSSGLRVNSAADDAAGLAIRELMRADIAALSQGQRNANDAISMIQVADGALGIIDEKLIRMKELAEQAATGTYDSTQRLIIDSEFQAMAAEIDRIARATDFNGIKLLDGSLTGAHDGSGLNAKGRMKIHFGAGNDSAEDYYYVDIGDCTIRGLGLTQPKKAAQPAPEIPVAPDVPITPDLPAGDMEYGKIIVSGNGMTFNDIPVDAKGQFISADIDTVSREWGQRLTWGQLMAASDGWHSLGRGRQQSLTASPVTDNCFLLYLTPGTTDVVINTCGCSACVLPTTGDNDIQVFTLSGKHLVGTPLSDNVYTQTRIVDRDERPALAVSMEEIIRTEGRVNMNAYDASELNTGPDVYDSTTLKYSTYNGMTFGYTGDPERQDSNPNNLALEDGPDYEILTIDVVTEPLVIALPGAAGAFLKAYQGKLDVVPTSAPTRDPIISPNPDLPPGQEPAEDDTESLSIETQEKAQKALVTIDNAIVTKDKIRAHLGALQNRLENTVSNLSIQAENLQASESRISDADIALEMMEFVRSQVLTQSAVAMLGQANSYPHMLMQLLG